MMCFYSFIRTIPNRGIITPKTLEIYLNYMDGTTNMIERPSADRCICECSCPASAHKVVKNKRGPCLECACWHYKWTHTLELPRAPKPPAPPPNEWYVRGVRVPSAPETEYRNESWGKTYPKSQMKKWKSQPWWKRVQEWPDGTLRLPGIVLLLLRGK